MVDNNRSVLKTILESVPKVLSLAIRLPHLGGVTDIGGRGVKMYWPRETVRLMRLMPEQGIFLTGIENADPIVSGGLRRNQLKEAFDFESNYEQRLERISALGIKWLRFGLPYSQAHLGPSEYNFELMDKVMRKCRELGITIIADMLHFGLPEWQHKQHPDQKFFQNPEFPSWFAQYAEAFARRYSDIRHYTMVNEPMVTAYLSSKTGLWNEQIETPWHDDKHFIRAVTNIARAAILGRQKIEQIWFESGRSGQPLFVQNESFELALAAPGSEREAEADRFNLRRFSALDLIFGHRDEIMANYLLSQGMSAEQYDWFMSNGTTAATILGIDHYPWCIHTLEADRIVDNTPAQPYQLRELVREYWQRYPLPLLHTEVNGQPEFAESLCQQTYDVLKQLSDEGYPVIGMGWYGDELQIGWQAVMSPKIGPNYLDEYPVGLHYKGQVQPVAALFSQLGQQGIKNSAPRGQDLWSYWGGIFKANSIKRQN
jgi:hypothetical protein